MYRHRIVRHRGHRDGDAMIAVRHIEGAPWRCFCGQENTDDDGRCGFCNSLREDWLCEECGRKNRKADNECSECGSPRPDAD